MDELDRQIVSGPGVPPQIGPYSQAVRAAGLVFVAGQPGIDPESGEPAGPTFGEQARQAFTNLEAVLLAGGSRPDLVVKLVPIGANFHYDGLAPISLDPESQIAGMIARAYGERSPDGPDHFPVVMGKAMTLFANEPTMTTDDLAGITAPTLVLTGDDDGVRLRDSLEEPRYAGADPRVLPAVEDDVDAGFHQVGRQRVLYPLLVLRHAPRVADEALRRAESLLVGKRLEAEDRLLVTRARVRCAPL